MKSIDSDIIKDKSYWIKELNAVPSEKYKANGVTRWDVNDNVYLNNLNLTKLPLEFGIVTGYFDCSDNQLETLEGAPQKVGKDFYCFDNQLETLEGAPQYVGEGFHCYSNKLKTLKGAPQKVGGYFNCENNYLTSLEGIPIEVGGYFDCSNNKLISLKGCPQTIGGDLYFSDNPLEHLNDLMGVQIKGEINIFHNTYINALYNTNLKTLEYILNNYKYWFLNDEIEKEFYMNIEQITTKKRLELILV